MGVNSGCNWCGKVMSASIAGYCCLQCRNKSLSAISPTSAFTKLLTILARGEPIRLSVMEGKAFERLQETHSIYQPDYLVGSYYYMITKRGVELLAYIMTARERAKGKQCNNRQNLIA